MYRVTDLTPLARGGGAGVPANTSQQRPLTERGTVAVAPTSESDRMVVVTTSSSKDYGVVIPAGNWSPRGTSLPALGAECLVVFDDVGDAFVPTWAGATTFPVVTGADWIAPTLLNSWVNAGGAFETAGYLKDPLGFVHLKGVVQSGTSGTAVFVLPTGYRPGATTDNSGGFNSTNPSQVQIDASGNVKAFISVAGGVGLSGVTFLAEN